MHPHQENSNPDRLLVSWSSHWLDGLNLCVTRQTSMSCTCCPPTKCCVPRGTNPLIVVFTTGTSPCTGTDNGVSVTCPFSFYSAPFLIYEGNFVSACGQTIYLRVAITSQIATVCGIGASCDGVTFAGSATLSPDINCPTVKKLYFSGLSLPNGFTGCIAACEVTNPTVWCGYVTW